MIDFVETPTYYLVRRTDVSLREMVDRVGWVAGDALGTTWGIYELWATGVYRGPFNTREEAIEREELIAKEYEWTLTLLEENGDALLEGLVGMLEASGCYQDLEGNVVWRREWPRVAKALEVYKQVTGREAPVPPGA